MAKKRLKVECQCFNGHVHSSMQDVDMDTGVTSYPDCPSCGKRAQFGAICGLTNKEYALIMGL